MLSLAFGRSFELPLHTGLSSRNSWHRFRYQVFPWTRVIEESNSYYQHSLDYISPDILRYTCHSWNVSSVILPITQCSCRIHPSHWNSFRVSESSANLQICLRVVITAHLHPEAHILPVDITGAMGALFCFCFFFFNSTFGLVQRHAPLLILCIRGKF